MMFYICVGLALDLRLGVFAFRVYKGKAARF